MNLHIQKNGKKGSSKGFYIALGVCLIAIGVAAWTTYDSVVHYASPEDKSQSGTVQSETKPANNTVSGVYGEPASSQAESKSSSRPAGRSSQPETKSAPQPKHSSLPHKSASVETASYSYPVGRTIVQKFSSDPVYCKETMDWRAHTGVDLSAQKGEAVKAIADGKVLRVYCDDNYGNTVVISHDKVEAWYCGLEQMKVKAGDAVTAKQEIGTVGVVPIEQKEASHLHFAIKVNGEFVDPLTLLK